MYMTQAQKQQKSLTELPKGDNVHTYWALNDVGTCLFIKGQALEAQGNAKGASAVYQKLMNELKFSQCWDERGWFWRPADAAAGRLKAIEYHTLD